MYTDAIPDLPRINARPLDAFDVFNLKHYIGPNPYLDTAALVFDLALTENPSPLRVDEYLPLIGQHLPYLQREAFLSPIHLFARVAAEMNQLDMGLHTTRYSLKPDRDSTRIALQTLHGRTTRAVIFLVWDWLEAIRHGETFEFESQLRRLQMIFRESVFGGPTVYALVRTAYEKKIPTFYLWNEGLVQYGYGRHQVRGAATTFDRDSRLDSDFTTRKDDCKAFLAKFGFPVPKGDVVRSLKGSLAVADEMGYPVVIKPVAGHKGIGVTANVRGPEELEQAYDRAVDTIPEELPIELIVEKHVEGTDFRLLCVDGRFVAATERRPASIVGDGTSTIGELVDRENASPARLDTPTSPLGKILVDQAMIEFLGEQNLTLDSIVERGQTVVLRKVANLSAGGVSLDATRMIHLDNIILAQDIAQHFRLTCLGIDVITRNLATSWKQGNLGIIEINAAPGIFMHLKPAIGESVDVPSYILNTFFQQPTEARIPVLTFNQISMQELQETVDQVLYRHPNWTIGAVCEQGMLINRAEKSLSEDYNTNIQHLLRNPRLDLLIAEYSETILNRDGMFHEGSDMVVLDNPTQIEMMLARSALDHSTVIIKDGSDVSIQSQGLMEQYRLGSNEPFKRVYLKEIAKIL